MAQWYAQVGSQRYGPASEEEIRRWYTEGRVKPADFVWSEGMATWVQASQAFGMVGQIPPPPAAGVSHRGILVLVMGILSLVVGCVGWIFGIAAVVMANRDLPEMTAGRMDRSGEGMTKAGKICGIIGIILGVVQLFAVIFAMLMAVFTSSVHHGSFH